MIQDFTVIKSLGLGATSEVFEAVNNVTGQRVALKSFSPMVLADDEVTGRIRDEANALQAIHHPNVVKLLSQKKEKDFFGLELELVDGVHLGRWAKNYELSFIEPKLWILAQVARGLGAAHEQNILHRDLKPENVLVSDGGDVKITDFGLSRSMNRLTVTRLGLLVGSLGYMASEIIAGEKATPSSDLFSLGALSYELLSGQPAFEGETPQAMIKKITDSDFKPLRQIAPWVPPSIAKIVEDALHRDPKKRPSTVWEFEATLMTWLSKTDLLPFCRSLASQECSVLRDVLQTKHENLLKRAHATFENRSENSDWRSQLIFLVSEIQSLFPEEPQLSELMEKVKNQTTRDRKYLYLIVAVITAVVVGLTLMSRQAEVQPESLQKDTHEVVASTNPPNVASHSSVPSASTKVEEGKIRFSVDPDVEVYLNDEFIPPSRWHSLTYRVGNHRMKLMKQGFVPLESFVTVRAGRTTTVKAGGK